MRKRHEGKKTDSDNVLEVKDRMAENRVDDN